VVIVSGLAYGIDAIAHRAALDADLKTIAIPGSGLDDSVLYPRENVRLAEEILRRGGALISPFEDTLPAAQWTFPHRNRIMAGISHATLVIEADIRSGTLITSKFAGDFNRNVLTVPGSIFTSKSAGPHMLLKIGATPITSVDDLILALGFTPETKRDAKTTFNLSPDEERILEALHNPLSRSELFETVALDSSAMSVALSLLELKGLVEETLGNIRKVC
jgi:DNA processing protein